jgi:hypothetical protein
MKSSSLKFMISVIVLAAICALLQIAVDRQTGGSMKLKSGFLLLSIFALVTIGIHLFLMNSAKDSGQAFVRSFMAATMAKFLLYLSVLVVFLVFSGENNKALAIHFLFFYLVFTIFEVSMLYSGVRKTK